MPSQPLKPFTPPTGIFVQLPASISAHAMMTLLFYFAVVCWVVYTLIVIYHWLTYSHASRIAFPAIIAHLAVSLALMSYALSGLL